MTTPTTRQTPRGPYAYTPPQDDTPKIIRRARIVITLVLIPLAMKAFGDEYGVVPLLSDVNTAIHEFGHTLFMPFGETMMILGGSLFQVLLPLVFVVYFLYAPRREHRDLHASMVCLWWTSISLMQVAIYAADARKLQLMLLTGAVAEENPENHDWRNLFLTWGELSRDTVWAGRMRAVAALMCIASILIGLWAAMQSGRPKEDQAETA